MFKKIKHRLKELIFKYFLLIFSPFFLTFLFFLKIFFLLKKKKVSFILLENRFFGHFAINTELSLLKYKADIYIGSFQSRKSCNKELEIIISKKINLFLNSTILTLSLNSLNLFPYFIGDYFLFLKFDYFREYKYLNLLNNNKILFANYNSNLDNNFYSANSLDPKRPIISIAIRDSAYHNQLYGQSSQDYRNQDPKKLINIIKSITNMGFNVVKIGRNSKFSIQNFKYFFDYSSSSIQNDLFDINILHKSAALISTGFGILALGQVMRKKILILNYAPWQTFPTGLENNWVIPAIIHNNIRKNHANFHEILSKDYIFFGQRHFDVNNLSVKNHNQIIINNSIIEFINFTKKNQLSKTQIEYNNLFWEKFHININERFLKIHNSYKCLIPTIYLKEYIDIYNDN